MILNITNGEYFNNYIKERIEGIFVPFNESMIYGPNATNIFDDEFINIRSSFHNITKEEYIYKLNNINNQNYLKSFDEIILWFGYDTFCQMNLLTLLAYFDQINYSNNVYLIIIDDYTKEIVRTKEQISFSNMKYIYNNVLCNKKYIETNIDFLNISIHSYLDFTFCKDKTSKYIQNNLNQDYNTLINEALNLSKYLGLSDTIIDQKIKEYLNSKFYNLYYQNHHIGNLIFNQKNLNIVYTPIIENIKMFDSNNLLHHFLKEDYIGPLKTFPFFEQRLSNMKKFNMKEVQYINDYYLLKEIS